MKRSKFSEAQIAFVLKQAEVGTTIGSEGRCVASCSNEVLAMDFVHGQLATGSKLRILTVIKLDDAQPGGSRSGNSSYRHPSSLSAA